MATHVTQPSYFALVLEIGDFFLKRHTLLRTCWGPFGNSQLPSSGFRTDKMSVLPVPRGSGLGLGKRRSLVTALPLALARWRTLNTPFAVLLRHEEPRPSMSKINRSANSTKRKYYTTLTLYRARGIIEVLVSGFYVSRSRDWSVRAMQRE